MPDRAAKLACSEPAIKSIILLHERLPFTSYFELLRKFRALIVVEYRAGFGGTFLESGPPQQSSPSGNQGKEINICKGRRRSADILYSYSQEPWITRRSRHLHQVSESGHR